MARDMLFALLRKLQRGQLILEDGGEQASFGEFSEDFPLRERFFANIEQVRELEFPDPFIRMWEFYLCYCEAGFMERYLRDVQLVFTKPLCRRDPILPKLS